MFGTGDLLAQAITNYSSEEKKRMDLTRTARAVTYGGLIFGPIGSKYYQLLQKVRIPMANPQNKKSIEFMSEVFPRVFVDQLGFSPCACAFYYVAMGYMEGITNWNEIVETKLEPNWWPTYKTNLLIWPAIQFANFSFIPVPYRLLTVNVAGVGWNAFISYRNAHKVVHNTEQEGK